MVAIAAPDERRALMLLRVAGGAAFLLLAIMLAIFPPWPVRENVPGFQGAVVGFELSSTPEHVLGILGAPDDPARPETVRRMDLGNRLDFLFMIAYPAFFVGIALLLAAHGSLSPGSRTALIALAVVMGCSDALENRQMLVLSHLTDPAAMLPFLHRLGFWTRLKWYAIFAASALTALGVWREHGWWRWSAIFFGIAALCGAVSLVFLPAIETGANVLALGWLMTYVRAWRRR